MLKKANRLSKNLDVKRAMRGRSFFGPRFVIKFVSSKNPGHLTRATVVVSTKVSKRAVVRNSIKRRIREAVRRNLDMFRGGDYVIIVKPSVIQLADDVLVKDFMDFLKKSRIIS